MAAPPRRRGGKSEHCSSWFRLTRSQAVANGHVPVMPGTDSATENIQPFLKRRAIGEIVR